jgi:hypothetical protein
VGLDKGNRRVDFKPRGSWFNTERVNTENLYTIKWGARLVNARHWVGDSETARWWEQIAESDRSWKKNYNDRGYDASVSSGLRKMIVPRGTARFNYDADDLMTTVKH